MLTAIIVIALPIAGVLLFATTKPDPTPFVSKLMQVFMNLDTMIGKDFERGLANLKAISER